MTADPTQRIDELFARFIARDPSAIEAAVHPDAELHTRLAAVAGEPYRGHDGARRWMSDLEERFSHYSPRVEELVETDSGDVLALGEVDLVGRGSDVSFVQPMAWLFSFADDGRVLRMVAFQNHAEARKAAGLL